MHRSGGSLAHGKLLDWLEASAATLHPSLGLRPFANEGVGAVALADIPADTTLFSLPRHLVFSTRTAPLLTLLSDTEQSSLGEGWTSLILAMMFESLRGGESPWAAYFEILPTRFDSLLWWSEREVAELRGSAVLGASGRLVAKRLEELRQRADKIGKEEAEQDYHLRLLPLVQNRPDLFGEAARYTLELYHRMGSCILSRSFTVLPPGVAIEDGSDDDERQDVGDVAMVPLAGALVRIVFVLRLDRSTDALNARSGHDNARLYYESSETLDMRTTQAIRQGAQIYNTYADPPNSDLLRRYGHVDEPNPYDVVELGADLLADVACANDEALKALIPAKVEWALEHEIDDSFALSYDELLPDEFIAAAHLFRLDVAGFATVQKKRKLRAPKPEDDADLVALLKRALDSREAMYPTSLEDDDRLLLEKSLPLRRRMAVVVRRGEKVILRAAKSALEEAVASAPRSAKRARKA